ncbi:SDR family NAD(P)-dependent oxidoreductase [Flavisphingomonas formosensis]|uniref:SDR family NAD(P)-dependent oxidoreductase n=1 Tax=Flavisphingomonas formosensis TaxID=861534 RepID=UPI0012F7CC31|nr:SDR family oxidoreductase [Sphingomonas formosensis]
MARLEGKVAVVLGASAAGGTGWTIAETLAAEGAHVVVAARRRGPLETLAQRIDGHAVVCDAGVPEQVAALAQEARDRFGPIDIAVNSAALPIMGLIGETPQASVERALSVNYLGQVSFVREMAAAMRDGGLIALISSSAAMQPILPFFPYACAKAATDCLVRFAALEYGPRGIRVNSILPGPIKTELAAPLFANPAAEAIMAREVPLGRVGLPEDFAEAVLALEQARYVSGVNLPVSGGMHLTRAARMDELPV